MAETLDSVVKKLKLKAEPRANALTFRLGVKKYSLPFETRTLLSGEYLFVQVPPSSAIFKFCEDGLTEVVDAGEAVAAAKSFRAPRTRSGAKAEASAELPEEVRQALSKIPAGYKLSYDKEGNPRLVRARKRRKGA